MTTHQPSPARRRAFTLIEVLIAAFVIAIGLIGLTALFAGAAGQQQTSSLVSQGDAHARNAEAVLGPLFGRLVEDDAQAAARFNVWRPLAIEYSDNDDFTIIADDGVDACPNRWFVAESAQSLPILVFDNLNEEFGDGDDSTSDLGVRLFQFDLGERAIDPESLIIRVEIVEATNFSGPAEEVLYSRLPGVDYFDGPPCIGPTKFPAGGDPIALQPGQEDYIEVDLQRSRDGLANADITDLRIRDIENNPSLKKIRKIEIVAMKRRVHQLVSLADRTLSREDTSAPSGRRPYMAYSLAMRRTASSTDLGIFVYQLTPGSAAAEWGPPERKGDLDQSPSVAPLRDADLLLGFDDARDQYYFAAPSGQEAAVEWALTVGQTLLVRGFENPGADTSRYGADEPVRVVATERVNNRLRGYLDRGPRVGRESLLPLARRRNNQVQNARVMGVNDTVTSLKDGSSWRLRSLGGYVFKVPLGGA